MIGRSTGTERGRVMVAAVAAAITSFSFAGTDGNRMLSCGWGSGNVVAFDGLSGAVESLLVPTGSGGLGQAHSVRQGPDGAIYVTSVASNRVLRYDAHDGTFLGVFASPAGTPLSAPTDAVFGPDGHLYVASFNTGHVLRFNGTSGAYLGVWGTGAGNGRVEMLAWGPDGNLYVTTGNGNSIGRFDPTGNYLGDFVMPGTGGLLDPHGFTFGPDGHIYVTAFGTPLGLKFNGTTGALMTDFEIIDDPGTPQNETGGLSQPHGIEFGIDGMIYVCSFGTNRILRYDTSGAFLDVFAAVGGFTQPTHLYFAMLGDTNGDGAVNVDDLVKVIVNWGPCPDGSTPCTGDVNGDDVVDVDDLVTVILNWG